jgi:hypothetical protein
MKLRSVVKNEDYEKSLSEIEKDYPRVRDFEQAIDWALARNPNRFNNLNNGYYLYKQSRNIDVPIPCMNVLYQVSEDDNEVIIIDISICD